MEEEFDAAVDAEFAVDVVAVFFGGAVPHGEDHADLPEGLAETEPFGDLDLLGGEEFANFRKEGERERTQSAQRENPELPANAFFYVFFVLFDSRCSPLRGCLRHSISLRSVAANRIPGFSPPPGGQTRLRRRGALHGCGVLRAQNPPGGCHCPIGLIRFHPRLIFRNLRKGIPDTLKRGLRRASRSRALTAINDSGMVFICLS